MIWKQRSRTKVGDLLRYLIFFDDFEVLFFFQIVFLPQILKVEITQPFISAINKNESLVLNCIFDSYLLLIPSS